ncbi:hypothetical protein STBA_34030 [Streptomyces sp. MP131-18]|nr:hypothetical protein STBA_34030 [Streptomyces sp. MP131-18]
MNAAVAEGQKAPQAPVRSFRNVFTATGRLRNRWADAVAEPDPAQALERLRRLRDVLAARPAPAGVLWVPFVASVTDPRLLGLLGEEDFTALAEAGRQLAGPAFTLEQAWRPLIAARAARGEAAAAGALLTELYWAPGSDEAARDAAASDLARAGHRGPEHLRIYAARLARGGPLPPGVPERVAEVLRVGFTDDADTLAAAAELAGPARPAGVPGAARALGLHRLRVAGRPAEAREHFAAACTADPHDETALLGLLAAWIRTGEAAGTPGWLRGRCRRAAPGGALARLGELIDVLTWLDADTDESPPARAEHVGTLALEAYVGAWFAYARGRLHLVEGDAERAHAALDPVTAFAERNGGADAPPGRDLWIYHGAWAELLTGRARDRGRAAVPWALGCLLWDADPGLTAGLTVSGPPAGYARVGAARRDLAAGTRPGAEPGPLPAGAGTPERLEALRTALGEAYARRGADGMRTLLRHPLYRRLPRADRFLWSGLRSLAGEPEEAERLLGEAARLGHTRRAHLILAAHHLHAGRPRPARRLLDGCTGAKAEVLTAWSEALLPEDVPEDVPDDVPSAARDGAPALVAARRLEALGSGVPPYVASARGALWLRGGDAARAARDFEAALSAAPGTLPDEAYALAAAARAAADGTLAPDRRPGAAVWTAAERHPWAEWVLSVTALADDPEGFPLNRAERLRSLAERPGASADLAVPALATALAAAGTASESPARRAAFAAILHRLAARHPGPATHHAADLTAAAAALAAPEPEPGGQTSADRPLHALVTAALALEAGERERAAGRLAGVRGGTRAHRACALLADALAGRPPSAADGGPAADGEPAALGLLRAAALAGQDPDAALDALATAATTAAATTGDGGGNGGSDGDALAAVVDLTRALPALCARPAPGGGRRAGPAHAFAPYVRRLAEHGAEGLDPAVHARCATVVGEFALAGRLWRQAVTAAERGGGEAGEARGDYVRLLCHRAVAARQDGDPLRAARLLRHVARIAAGGPVEVASGEERDLR